MDELKIVFVSELPILVLETLDRSGGIEIMEAESICSNDALFCATCENNLEWLLPDDATLVKVLVGRLLCDINTSRVNSVTGFEDGTRADTNWPDAVFKW